MELCWLSPWVYLEGLKFENYILEAHNVDTWLNQDNFLTNLIVFNPIPVGLLRFRAKTMPQIKGKR